MTYKQWTSTDRCDLITIQNDLDEYCDILCAKLKILGPHDFGLNIFYSEEKDWARHTM